MKQEVLCVQVIKLRKIIIADTILYNDDLNQDIEVEVVSSICDGDRIALQLLFNRKGINENLNLSKIANILSTNIETMRLDSQYYSKNAELPCNVIFDNGAIEQVDIINSIDTNIFSDSYVKIVFVLSKESKVFFKTYFVTNESLSITLKK